MSWNLVKRIRRAGRVRYEVLCDCGRMSSVTYSTFKRYPPSHKRVVAT